MYKTLLPVLAGVAMLISAASGAAAQNLKDQIVGTWTIVSDEVMKDGKMSEPQGPHPLGSFMLDSSGHYSLTNVNPDTPKFASNNRSTGTDAENKTAVMGSISHFGTYTINPDGSVTFHIIGSSYPNWTGTDQKRMIQISGNQMKYTDLVSSVAPGASMGGVATIIFTRAK